MYDTGSPVERSRVYLRQARDELDVEIRTYPSPISGCDAQYNHLLAERRRLHLALEALDLPIHIPTPRAP